MRAVRNSARMQAALALRKRHLSSRQIPPPENNVFYAPVTSDLVTEPLWARFLLFGPRSVAIFEQMRFLFFEPPPGQDMRKLRCVGPSGIRRVRPLARLCPYLNTDFLERKANRHGNKFCTFLERFFGRFRGLYPAMSPRKRSQARIQPFERWYRISLLDASASVPHPGLTFQTQKIVLTKGMDSRIESLGLLRVLKGPEPAPSSQLRDGHLMKFFAFDGYCTQARTTFAGHRNTS
jgi:hypothetical protein